MEAPRRWWLRISEGLIDLGWFEVPLLPAMFVPYDAKGLCGILFLHVDDGLITGRGARCTKAVEELKARAPVGQWHRGDFKLTGRRLVQDQRTFETVMSQAEYWLDEKKGSDPSHEHAVQGGR